MSQLVTAFVHMSTQCGRILRSSASGAGATFRRSGTAWQKSGASLM
jgi:hypothetical protein